MKTTEDVLGSIGSYLTQLSPSHLCQLSFVLAAAGVLAVAATPSSARELLTRYGARQSTKEPDEDGIKRSRGTDSFTTLIRWFTSIGKVPHWWFIHFYVLSVSSSIFWAVQYIGNGSILQFIAEYQAARSSSSMTINQVILVWLLMGMQGARRLYECVFVLRPSSSEMWVVHWLLGNAYYFGIGVSIWIEGSRSILQSDRKSFHMATPSAKELIGLLAFLFAWSMQYRCHQHLSSLRKYSLPGTGMFRYLICPHYTCECLLYLSLAIIAAPQGQLYNKTLLCGLLFVSLNLGVTARDTKRWYADKFGFDQVREKWNMIPFIY